MVTEKLQDPEFLQHLPNTFAEMMLKDLEKEGMKFCNPDERTTDEDLRVKAIEKIKSFRRDVINQRENTVRHFSDLRIHF